MSKTSNKIGGRLRLSVELMFSIYLSLLIAFAVESRPPYAWTARGRYLYFWHRHAIALSWSDFILFYLEILLLPAISIFICVRLIERFVKSRAVLPTLWGVVAGTGLPLVYLISGGASSYFATVEPAAVAIGFILWANRKWPVSPPMTVFLLSLHYAFWCLYGIAKFDFVIRPWAWWGEWDYIALVLPTLGLAYTLVWACDFRRSGHQLLGSQEVQPSA
jgi:hypothetical protein